MHASSPMGVSRTPRHADSAESSTEAPVRPVVAVACSGGRDSTALLHAVCRQARGSSLQVIALHVHHGLNASADFWTDHLRRQTSRWRRAGMPVVLMTHRVSSTPPPSQSIEAWARDVRYAALAEMAVAHGAREVWLAHHRADQVETVLLNALRGGLDGLSAMRKQTSRLGIRWVRPWLNLPGTAIDSYVKRWRLSHIEDASNQEVRFSRNRIRLQVLPALVSAFPEAESQLAAIAEQVWLARQLAEEVADLDLSVCAPGGALLLRTPWLSFSPARRQGILRRWLHRHHDVRMPQSLLMRLMTELPSASTGACWPLTAEKRLQLHRGHVHVVHARPSQYLPCDLHETVPVHNLEETRLGVWAGTVRFEPVLNGGLTAERILHAVWRAKRGGDQFSFGLNRTARSLKKQFQDANIPSSSRNMPILCDATAQAGTVLFVPGLGVDARAQAPFGVAQWLPEWIPDQTPGIS